MTESQGADPKETFEALEAEVREATARLEDAELPLEERLRLHALATRIHERLEAALAEARRTLAEPVTADAAADDAAYETLRDELAETVTALETEGLPLARVLALHQRARRLAARCEAILMGAQERVGQLPDASREPGDEPDADDGPFPF